MSLALELTIFSKLFAAVAEEMGIVLRRSAFSPNIKEHRDYSCALCTAAGELLAQARPEVIPAAIQGTMNNVSFGGVSPKNGREFTYYETIGGGMGGRPQAPGLDRVHTHMTNTQNTPVEVLEHDYPVLITRYALRADSGGAGRCPGGWGEVEGEFGGGG